MFDLNLQRLLALVNADMHDSGIDEDLFVGVAENDWRELFAAAAKQRVSALAFNASLRLPQKLQPPMTIQLPQITRTEGIEKLYLQRLETAEELSRFFGENNIRMMVFKGVSLSALYPNPASRDFGDIDIYLCGKSVEGNVLLEKLTGNKGVGKITSKHTNFAYKGVMIENHHTFINKNSFKNSAFLEMYLEKMTVNAGTFPPPDFDALFVMLHTLRHFRSHINFRSLCDITVVFSAYKGKFDLSRYSECIAKAGLEKIAGAFVSLCVRYFGLNPDDAPPYQPDVALENRIWNDVLYPITLPIEKRTLWNVILFIPSLLKYYYWKSEAVYPGQYTRRILGSMVYYLKNPKNIRKVTG